MPRLPGPETLAPGDEELEALDWLDLARAVRIGHDAIFVDPLDVVDGVGA